VQQTTCDCGRYRAGGVLEYIGRAGEIFENESNGGQGDRSPVTASLLRRCCYEVRTESGACYGRREFLWTEPSRSSEARSISYPRRSITCIATSSDKKAVCEFDHSTDSRHMFLHPSLNLSPGSWLLGSNQNHARTVAWCSVSAPKKKEKIGDLQKAKCFQNKWYDGGNQGSVSGSCTLCLRFPALGMRGEVLSSF
jgi:hypothetical protein